MLKLFKLLFKKWPEVILITVILVTQCYLQLMLPDYMSDIQNNVIESNMDKILINGGIMLAISFGVVILACSQCFLSSHISAYIGKELRNEVFSKVTNLNLSNYDKFGTSTLITRTTNDIEQVKNFILMSVRILVMSPTMMIIALIKTVTREANLAIILAVAIPLILILMGIIFIIASPLFKKIQENIDNVTGVLRESLTGIRVIRAYNQQEVQAQKFKTVNTKMTNTIVKVGRTMSFANPSINLIFNLTFIGIYFLGFSLINGLNLATDTNIIQTTFANISAVALFANQIMMSFLMFAMVFIMVPQATASADRINEILNLNNNINDKDALSDSEIDSMRGDQKGTIEFKNVIFQYPDASNPTLHNISFKTSPGKTTAIIGSTGCGKSSLINLIPRFYDVTEGTITLDGIDIKKYNQKLLRSKIGFVPQTAVLFSGSIRDNIKFGNPELEDAEINKALEVSQSSNFVNKLEHKLDTFVAQSGKNFSGGQKQRLSIARAIVRKPELFVFDDSFSALDFKTDIKLRTSLKRYISKDAAVIIVAQRISTIIDADEIIVLDEGRIVGKGKHNFLLRNCEVYQDIVSSQLDADEVEKTIAMQKEVVLKGGK